MDENLKQKEQRNKKKSTQEYQRGDISWVTVVKGGEVDIGDGKRCHHLHDHYRLYE
jgi:hypothetical protein